jgi:hypothetical protein
MIFLSIICHNIEIERTKFILIHFLKLFCIILKIQKLLHTPFVFKRIFGSILFKNSTLNFAADIKLYTLLSLQFLCPYKIYIVINLGF